MLPRIDPAKSEPIYAQLVGEVKYFIATGMMSPGEALPSVREMALQLRINPNTVARAYRGLEREGVVNTVRGKGVFVSDSPRGGDKKLALSEIKRALDGILVDAFHMGISAEQVRELLSGRIDNMNKTREE
jgi:GntR family transcriptional regulator